MGKAVGAPIAIAVVIFGASIIAQQQAAPAPTGPIPAGLPEWAYTPPPAGGPQGEGVQGTVTRRGITARETFIATAEGASTPVFAPLITNATGVPLKVTVNPGTGAAKECGCTIPDGASRLGIGYYRLFQNSTVRVTAPDGRTATFPGFAASVNAGDGTVGLRFEAKDLRRP